MSDNQNVEFDENFFNPISHLWISVLGDGRTLELRYKISYSGEHDDICIPVPLFDVQPLIYRLAFLYDHIRERIINEGYPELKLVMNADAEYGPVPEKGPAEPSKHNSEIQAKRQCDDLEIEHKLNYLKEKSMISKLVEALMSQYKKYRTEELKRKSAKAQESSDKEEQDLNKPSKHHLELAADDLEEELCKKIAKHVLGSVVTRFNP